MSWEPAERSCRNLNPKLDIVAFTIHKPCKTSGNAAEDGVLALEAGMTYQTQTDHDHTMDENCSVLQGAPGATIWVATSISFAHQDAGMHLGFRTSKYTSVSV